MRTRTRLLWTFLAVHVAVTLITGLVTWLALTTFLRSQAEESAVNLARAIAARGFSPTPEVMARMEQLTGYEFVVLAGREEEVSGTIQAQVSGVVVRIDYRTPTYRRAQTLVLVGTLSLAGLGLVIIAAVSWWTASGLARPLERLARSARGIGDGDLDDAVPQVGSGEVALLAADLEAMRRHLRRLTEEYRRTERLETLGLFTATVAHEVRNPLSAVRLTVQLLARRYPDEEAVGLIENEMERLDLIVDELVSYSGGMQVEPVETDLAAIAGDCVRLLSRQAEHAGVTVRVEGDRHASVDPSRLKQLLLNLILNAIQAQHGGGEVTVRIDADGVAVIDRGEGVPAEVRATLFEPFSSGRRDGTGLGLHLAQTIAKAHGGEIVYEPADPGSVFRVTGI